MASTIKEIIVRQFGLCDYQQVYRTMSDFTTHRDELKPDEIWNLQHPPSFTLGLAGKPEHVLDAEAVPVIQTDRGGQVTYHGPGQLVCYLLLDMKRHKLSVKGLVNKLEQSLIDMLFDLGVEAGRKQGAPGVYVQDKKIAALGVRVRRGCCYHGLALNVDMDLSPFLQINPCGYPGLEVTQLRDFDIKFTVDKAANTLLPYLLRNLAYDGYNVVMKNHAGGFEIQQVQA